MNRYTFAALGIILVVSASVLADEGMHPMSEIHKLDLRARGFELHAKDLYNPEGISIVDGIVNVGGCTGSFVSQEGLILTNHHCAFGAVQAASTAENDYIRNGFLARSRAEEIPARGTTVRITESYRDVSHEILAGIDQISDPAERAKAIERRVKEIVTQTEKENPGKRATVSEMFAGRTYVLFMYTFLKDVRLVYAPPRSIGEFGGEQDNWIWPRHTGDFSFMRAYVGPDGSPAEYSMDNIPYRPRKVLKVQPDGADEGDFVFILGYPGRTYRHRTSHYLDYEYRIRMPFVIELNDWQIHTMEKEGENDRSVAIKHAARIKSLSNVMKNFRGKIRGIRRLDLVEKRRTDESTLQNFIDTVGVGSDKFRTTLTKIGEVYSEMADRAPYELTLDYLRSVPTAVQTAYTLYEAANELAKPDLERQSGYMERNLSQTRSSLLRSLQNYHEETDKEFLKEMLRRAASLPAHQRIPAIDRIFGKDRSENAISRFVNRVYRDSDLMNPREVEDAWGKSPENLLDLDDPFIELAAALYPTMQELRGTRQTRDGKLTSLHALLVEAKQMFMKSDFIPDANSTLRLTYGWIKGYSPADGVYCEPITTLTGVVEKTTGIEPFDTPTQVLHLSKARDFGRYKHKKLNDVPVAILYNLDTTGGNSGSPVMNARGEVVGVNFDRAWEATINDYTWSADYSRSIGVDIRYVLWVSEKLGGAGHLLQEMGIGRSQ